MIETHRYEEWGVSEKPYALEVCAERSGTSLVLRISGSQTTVCGLADLLAVKGLIDTVLQSPDAYAWAEEEYEWLKRRALKNNEWRKDKYTFDEKREIPKILLDFMGEKRAEKEKEKKKDKEE